MSALFEDRAVRYMTDLIRDFKLEDYQAAGFPGNFGAETGGFVHVQEIDPAAGRGGLGDAQWTGSRRVDFETWIARNVGKGWDARTYEANYSMLFRELEGPENASLTAVRAARDVDEATEIVMRRYERPGVERLAERKDYGRQALAAFRARGIDVAALKAQGRPGTVEVLPPALPGTPSGNGQVDLGQLLTILLPVLQQVLTSPQAQQVIAPLIAQVFKLPAADPAPAPSAPAPAPTGTSLARPSVWLSIASLAAAALGIDQGVIGTPFGTGIAPTTTGTLSVLAPLATAAIGATGGFAPFAKIGLTIAGALAQSFINRQQK